MKALLLLIISVLSLFHSQAQDWQPIYANETLNYTSSSNPEPFGVFADTVFGYNGNPDHIRLTLYLDSLTECAAPYCSDCHRLRATFLQSYMVNQPNGVVSFQNPDTFHIHTLANLGDSWMFKTDSLGEEITATVSAIQETEILGQTDSIKIITLSVGDEIHLSKHHGITYWAGDSDTLTLTSIPIRNPEEMYLTKRQVYDFNVGDVFSYYSYSSEASQEGNYSQNKRVTLYEVVEVLETDTNRVIQFAVNQIRKGQYSMGGMTNYSTQFSQFNTTVTKDFNSMNELYQLPENSLWGAIDHPREGESILVRISPDEPSIIENNVRLRIIDHQAFNERKVLSYGMSDFMFDIDENESLEEVLNDYNFFVNQTGRKISDCNDEYWNQFESGDTVTTSPSYGEYYTHHLQSAEGLGELFYFADILGLGSSYTELTKMIGYQKGEETSGFIPTIEDMIAVGVQEAYAEIQFSIYPNPANEYSEISFPDYKTAQITVYDITGRVIYSSTNVDENLRINTAAYKPGVYMVQLASEEGLGMRRLVVSR